MTRRARSIGRLTGPLRYVGLCLAGALAATSAAAQDAPPTPPAERAVAPEARADATVAYDPWQPMNRGLFAFGMGLDHAVFAPVTHGYMKVTPAPVRNRVTSMVYNLSEPSTVIEDVLQGHPRKAGRATARFVVNSTVGVLGLFDVAARWGLEPHESDFGQTLGRYGAQPGPYIFVPVVGPTNLRDGIGRIVDVATDPIGFITGPITSTPGAIRYGVTALDQRALSDPAFEALKDATDPYVTTRSAYTQYRASVIQNATGKTQALPDFDETPSAQ
ncbi:MAG TPA: VacJ family lipoprotein [Phenylobacterium sp.]|uniref:MlaA family lipoprotein n=1 Tax=Phenylobacterium sp. TaxID=1871053 RepID=UPI002B47F21E|nr:VacJ family lipoprotein [Phenylobacterium sp.]HKR89251.1 VacJ family lipoprotein [Phenylobacterium sp.]